MWDKIKEKDKFKVKRKNVWKVAMVLIEDPNATYREIQEKTWLHPLTIQKANEELKQNWNKDETIAYIVGSAKDRLKRLSKIKDRYVWQLEENEVIGNKEIDIVVKIWAEDVKMTTVLWGTITDTEWGLKDFNQFMNDILNG